MAFRIDIGSLRPPEILPDGRLRAEGRLTRTGVFVYRDKDGNERREYRPPEEVFQSDSLSSFALAPVTDNHPADGIVTTKNHAMVAVGVIGENLRQDGEYVAATILIHDDATIRKMQSGKNQLSCGYVADVVDEPGVTPDGERYDAVQRNIRGNHVAVVDVGRAGPGARVRMDAAYMITGDESETKEAHSMDDLKKALVDLAAAEARADSEKARADAAEKKLETESARADSEKARADAAEKARADAADPAHVRSAVKARVALERAAAPVLRTDDGEADLSELTDRAIRVACIKRLDNVDVDETRSDEYVNAYFDAAMKRADAADNALAGARVATENGRQDDGLSVAERAHAAMVEYNRNAWKVKE